MRGSVQESTTEFGSRLRMAIESHPAAPAMEQGRQKWLLDRLADEGEVVVSANTVNKWYRGLARPREDNIRTLARLLQVDEVWLSLGRKPIDSPRVAETRAANANGAVLLFAGMVELAGGKVTFPGKEESGHHLWINLGDEKFGALVVVPQGQDERISFIVPEPVGASRVFAVMPRALRSVSAGYDLFEITDAPRQNFGGFSVVMCNRDGERKLSAEGKSLTPIKTLEDLGEGHDAARVPRS